MKKNISLNSYRFVSDPCSHHLITQDLYYPLRSKALDLYWQVRDYYSSDYALAKALSPYMNMCPKSIHQALRRSTFKYPLPTLKLMKALTLLSKDLNARI